LTPLERTSLRNQQAEKHSPAVILVGSRPTGIQIRHLFISQHRQPSN